MNPNLPIEQRYYVAAIHVLRVRRSQLLHAVFESVLEIEELNKAERQ